jgi:hypothetical protein
MWDSDCASYAGIGLGWVIFKKSTAKLQRCQRHHNTAREEAFSQFAPVIYMQGKYIPYNSQLRVW